jgi:hypothetical protein
MSVRNRKNYNKSHELICRGPSQPKWQLGFSRLSRRCGDIACCGFVLAKFKVEVSGPTIGNLRQVPAERSDLQFAKWAKEYSEFVQVSDLALAAKHVISNAYSESDIIYVNLLGQPVIVLNSVKSAVDLLDKKGAIYSDRPRFVLLEAYCNTRPSFKIKSAN